MGVLTRSVVAVVAVAMVFSAVPMAGAAPDTAKDASVEYSDFLRMKPGKLSGKVFYTDGKTAAADISVKVTNKASGEVVHSSVTDKKGLYQLPELPAGEYSIVYGNRVSVELRVEANGPKHELPLNVIIPRGKAAGASAAGVGAAGAKAALEVGATPLKSVLIVGGAAATAVGVVAAVVVANDRSSSCAN